MIYVPTDTQLQQILSLRREIRWAEQLLAQRKTELEDYERLIRLPMEAQTSILTGGSACPPKS